MPLLRLETDFTTGGGFTDPLQRSVSVWIDDVYKGVATNKDRVSFWLNDGQHTLQVQHTGWFQRKSTPLKITFIMNREDRQFFYCRGDFSFGTKLYEVDWEL